jgi:peptide deformylase
LLLYGDARLRATCRPVEPGEPGLAALIARMRAVMLRHDGVGLAAPQVGEPLRLIMAWPPDRRQGEPTVLLNPELVSLSALTETFDEGCLSFPGIYRPIVRPSVATVRYHDRHGEPKRLRAGGLLSRILQHELDHLDGVLLVDHLGTRARLDVVLRMRWHRLIERREV